MLLADPRTLVAPADRTKVPAVEFRGVSLAFDDRVVLNDLSFSVAPGSLTMLLGASGSGKTVLLKLILGLLRPDGGQIFVNGRRTDSLGERDLLGYHLGVVGVDRREVREHPRPVDALPPERVVRHAVLPVPRQLLCDEPAAPALGEDLGERRWVAEDVRDPHLRAAPTEPALERPLADDQLTDAGLTTRPFTTAS